MYATSWLSIDKKNSCISDSCWAKMSRSIEISFFWTGLRPSFQKLMFSFKRERKVSILSVFNISRRHTKNLLLLICRCWKNLFSSRSLYNLRVKLYSYPSSKSSCIIITCALKVKTNVLEVCFVRLKSEICAQNSTQSDYILKKLIFPSCKFTAWFKILDVYFFLKLLLSTSIISINSRK